MSMINENWCAGQSARAQKATEVKSCCWSARVARCSRLAGKPGEFCYCFESAETSCARLRLLRAVGSARGLQAAPAPRPSCSAHGRSSPGFDAPIETITRRRLSRSAPAGSARRSFVCAGSGARLAGRPLDRSAARPPDCSTGRSGQGHSDATRASADAKLASLTDA